ncbi:NADH:ubiquinone oxidoreductase chain I-like protein [Bernardetia litoralis DSM 6794]|uniref:NADH:ubiquinone oxidoreductase chain I-like protein n=1 Tax=Bernardetia litoralis (strain ATCC 23117 / DSM 6794 / NBRC 15988 / NCIMB 1366 / Fx l1 / Sio-4) TaxID=880071 RepID=I4AQI0_BERLS|nr:4Fe-4S dicluster domain-containing protein [Bernardetia litoralis]AFM06215.1 NADH:ubiquinone oxidoreductase chain I-like protein [Bernardetia litoralis DSM 6794]
MSTNNNKKTYWKDLKEATQTTAKGLELTWEHFQKSIRSLAQKDMENAVSAKNQSFDNNSTSNLGIVTNLYPHEMMPIPDNGRYKLHNEIDDCIVCNKCVEVCPVNCIEIDAIRGTEQVGTASDGSPIRFYAAKFDIDMAKCCFCGLCTVVCPTECLTMTKEFDFSEMDIAKMTYEFGNLKDNEIIEKQKEWDDFQAEKAAKKAKTSKPILKVKPIENKEQIVENDNKKSVIKIKIPTKKVETTEKTETKPKIKIKIPTKKVETTEKTEQNLRLK